MKYKKLHPSSTRSELLRKISQMDNQGGWTEFADEYSGYIFFIAQQYGLQEADAEDIVQIVLLEVAKSISTFTYDREKGRFRAWLSTIAKRRITDFLRQQTRRGRHEITGGGHTESQMAALVRKSNPLPDDFQELMDKEWQSIVQSTALKRTREQVGLKQFPLFHAYVIEEWPVEKVMQTYGVSRDQVYQAKHRIGPIYAEAAKQAAQDLDAPFGA